MMFAKLARGLALPHAQGLSLARDAGYDLVLFGLIESPRDTDMLAVDYKIIEVEAGVTVIYGRETVSSLEELYDKSLNRLSALGINNLSGYFFLLGR